MGEERRHPVADLPAPSVVWRSRFEPSGIRVVDVQAPQAIEADRLVELRECRVERGGVGDVDPRDEPVARVEADAEARMPVEGVEDRGELGDRPAHRSAGAGGVLEDQPEPVVRKLEQPAQRRPGALQPLRIPSPRCEPTWKTTPSASIADAVSSDERIAVTDFLWMSLSGVARLTR